MVKHFDKKAASEASVNEQLAEELHKPVTKIFKKRKVYVRFKACVCYFLSNFYFFTK